ncbi:MAG TPA: hypothetical protein VFA48_06065 [Gammaproteobacteria bacterium]|nr:hypothetical protein [Gammaproteobacteria bacterium]
MELEPGMIIYYRHTIDESGGKLHHYGLVVSVEGTLAGLIAIRVAYGSSKKVSVDGHLPHEFVVADARELEETGLRKPTRFDMRRTLVIMPEDIIEVVGHAKANKQLLRRLGKAYVASM